MSPLPLAAVLALAMAPAVAAPTERWVGPPALHEQVENAATISVRFCEPGHDCIDMAPGSRLALTPPDVDQPMRMDALIKDGIVKACGRDLPIAEVAMKRMLVEAEHPVIRVLIGDEPLKKACRAKAVRPPSRPTR